MNASTLLLPLLEELVNRLLRLDAQALRRLGELHGRVVCVRVARGGGEPVTLYMALSESGLRLLTGHDAPDVTISGSVPVFARLVLGAQAPSPSAATGLLISGDIELGQRFQRILQAIDIDWEEQTARVVGDVPAHQLARAARAAHAWGRHAVQTLGQDFTEYFQEESRLLAKRQAVETFLRAVDTLRADTDRLAKRLERMEGDAR
jgi:ubiquinone biosynthesis protein UbiJ